MPDVTRFTSRSRFYSLESLFPVRGISDFRDLLINVFSLCSLGLLIQLSTFAYKRLLNKPYENEVTLRGQKSPLKCCQYFGFQCPFFKGLDISMLKIWGLWVKGLQSCHPSNFENDSTPVRVKPGPNGSSGAGAGQQTFS